MPSIPPIDINTGGAGNYNSNTAGSNPFDTEVTKFGPNSFYNWEMDNIPIVQLEERTNELYALTMAGLTENSTYDPGVGGPGYTAAARRNSVPISSGSTFTLSATSNPGLHVYASLDTLISRIPKIIKYPILIEICKYGDLGVLDLHGFTCEGEGSLEIVNRNFALTHPGTSGTYDKVTAVTTVAGYPDSTSSVFISAVSSTTLQTDIVAASSTRLGQNCFSTSAWGEYHRAFITQDFSTDSKLAPLNFSQGTTGVRFRADVSAGFAFNSYAPTSDLSISSLDASPKERQGLGTYTLKSELDAPAATNTFNGVMYGNYFSKISVRDCHGEYIKLKGLCVDSASGTGATLEHRTNAGLMVENSDIILESVASARNRFCGFQFDNSKIRIRNGIIGYRNYPLYGAGTSTVPLRTALDSEYEVSEEIVRKGVGMFARNSMVIFNDKTDLTNDASSVYPGRHANIMSHNGVGIYGVDSIFAGGIGGHTNTADSQGGGALDHQTTKLASCFNTKGLVLEGSKFLYQGIPWAYANEGDGITLSNSVFKSLGLISEFNQGNGLTAKSSEVVYGFGIDNYSAAYDISAVNETKRAAQGTRNAQVHIDRNGTHNIHATKSSVTYEKTANVHEKYGVVGGGSSGRSMTSFGGGYLGKDYLPLIVADNSYMELISLGASLTGASTNVACKGYALESKNNSYVSLEGNKCFPTVAYRTASIATAAHLLQIQKSAAICAEGNSTVAISGPTKISGFGVGCLSENKSTILFDAHKRNGELDIKGYDLTGTPENHSKIEIQALRACIVSNKNSSLEMKNLGGYPHDTTNTVDTWDSIISAATSSGSFKFYPNGFTSTLLSTTAGKHGNMSFPVSLNVGSNAHDRDTVSFGTQDSAGTGGMCVRCVGDSSVKVNNTNFLMDATPADLSGVYYNIEGSGLEHQYGYAGLTGDPDIGDTSAHYGGSQIYIWNIADSSKIEAANVRVNGAHPSGSGYHGPAGKWWNNVGLDYYGSNGKAGAAAGVTLLTYENYGPFRLMMGTRGVVKTYYDLSSTTSVPLGLVKDFGGTPIDQINGQGYMSPVSSVSSLTNSDISYYHQYENYATGEAIFGGVSGMIQDSTNGTFPIVSIPVLNSDWQGYMRNYIDESAACLFANAKHAANEKVGFVSIYRSTTESVRGGEGRDSSMSKGMRSTNLFDLDRIV